MIRILFVFTFFFSFCAIADDWPCWRGEQGDGFADFSGKSLQWPMKGPKEIWRAPLGTGYSGLSIANGIICTLYGDNEYEYCVAFSEQDGKEIWRRRIGYIFINNHGNGPRSTPTISGDKVYVVSSYGELYCLHIQNGKKIWNYNIIKKFSGQQLVWGTTSSPLVYKDKLFFNTGAQKGKSIVALSKETGDLVWASSNEQTSYASPILIKHDTKEPYILFFAGTGGIAVTPENGNILWQYPWATTSNVNAASPLFLKDHIYFSSSYSMGSTVIKVDSQDNYKVTEIWKTRKIQNHFSSSILWQEHIYGFDDNILVCIDFMTGKVNWKQRGFKKGTIAGLKNGDALVLGEDGNLALIELNKDEYISKGEFQPFPSSICRTIPTIVNNHIYMRNQEEMICYDLGIHDE